MRVHTRSPPTILAFHKLLTAQDRVTRTYWAILRVPVVLIYLGSDAMQSPHSSTGANVCQIGAISDYLATINQLQAKVQEQEGLLLGMNLVNGQVLQSVYDLQHQALWTDYLQRREALSRHQQLMSLEYSQQYGTLSLYQGASPTEIVSQQVQQQLASVVAHHHHYYQAEEARISAAPIPQQVEYSYAPRIINAQEVEQGKYTPATVFFQEDTVVQPPARQTTVISPSAADAVTEPVLSTDINNIDVLEIPAEESCWNPWDFSILRAQENKPQN